MKLKKREHRLRFVAKFAGVTVKGYIPPHGKNVLLIDINN